MTRLKAARLAHSVEPIHKKLPTATPSIFEMEKAKDEPRAKPRNSRNRIPFPTASPALNVSETKSGPVRKGSETPLAGWEKAIQGLENTLLDVQRLSMETKHALKHVPTIPPKQQQKLLESSSDSSGHNKKGTRSQKRVLGDVEVLSLVEALESLMLCGLEGKVAKLEPPSFWPVVKIISIDSREIACNT